MVGGAREPGSSSEGEAVPREPAAPRAVHRPCPATLGAQHWPRPSSQEAVGWVLVPGLRPSSCAKHHGHRSPTFIHPACLAGPAEAWWHCPRQVTKAPFKTSVCSAHPRPQGLPAPRLPRSAPWRPRLPCSAQGPQCWLCFQDSSLFWPHQGSSGVSVPRSGTEPQPWQGTRSPDCWPTRSSL